MRDGKFNKSLSFQNNFMITGPDLQHNVHYQYVFRTKSNKTRLIDNKSDNFHKQISKSLGEVTHV